jgi:phenylalanine-4-hydroxylase
MRTPYRTDAFQRGYFVIERFQDVLDLVLRNDLPALLSELETLPDLSFGAVAQDDRLAA